MKRVVIPELLDTDAGTPREVAGSLADIDTVNQHLGGVKTMTSLLRTVATKRALKSLSWLDVAGARGGMAAKAVTALAKRGLPVTPVLLDRAASHLSNDTTAVCGDALQLPFRDGSFDVVGCCLFLHHLEPEEIVGFVNEALRVARYAVLINDLIRHPLHLWMARAGKPIYRSRITRHDAPASVRRAYTAGEMGEMLRRTRAPQVDISENFFFRMGVVAWKHPNSI
ncbi:MAG TPA: methyltransferase domain-containing protein [Candidatus Saccharimonadales bacterium]|jgi:ubiquinone/menaquinone biosynthesis C-methylase UbiE|nr:methyltransferase domain-containing protein [Candidatus Saccharimonadales bacterium]